MQRELRRELRRDSIIDGDGVTEPLELDVLVIGGGFAGCYLLHNLRKQNFNTKVVEAGTGLGGIWHWNAYPGARVDSQFPVYALSIPEVYNTWYWTQNYPGSAELRDYFKHMDKVLDLSKDVFYRTTVLGADFDRETNKWTVRCQNGKLFRASFLIASVGFAARRFIPDSPGLDKFAGRMLHSSFWPHEGIDVSGKKTAVIGTGATGVQIIQEWAKEADELTVFQRTPNMALPMNQAALTVEEQDRERPNMEKHLKFRFSTDGGFMYTSRKDIKMLEQSAEAREELFEELWSMGGFRFIANNYGDLLTDTEANRHAYEFWSRKQRARIHDKAVADILVPTLENMPHAWGGKRPSLEQDYYDVFNRPNVHIVNVRQNGIKEFVPEGIITEDGKLHEVDVIALATGFDSVTGGLKDIELRSNTFSPEKQANGGPVIHEKRKRTAEEFDGNKPSKRTRLSTKRRNEQVGLISGEADDKSPSRPKSLAEYWKNGALTYLGMSVHGFPNFFFTYGPQAPTAFSNGPSCVEPQVNWIVDVLCRMREQGLTRIEAKAESEIEWKKKVMHFSQLSLRHNVDGWYNGQNIPGKPREPLNYSGGLPRYQQEIKDVLENNFAGFEVQ